MRATFIAWVCLALGCAPAGHPSSKSQDIWSGTYVGRLPADGTKPSQTVTSDALAAALGGYKLKITEDRQFLLEARGRVLQGKVEEEGSGLTLTVERVFGMTRQQLLADRNRLDDVESDMKWFDKKLVMRIDGEGVLRLEPDDSEGETVVFTRELPKN
jgi:hypothetical protein